MHSTFSVIRFCANFVACLKPLDKNCGFGVDVSSQRAGLFPQLAIGPWILTLSNSFEQSSAGVVSPDDEGDGSETV